MSETKVKDVVDEVKDEDAKEEREERELETIAKKLRNGSKALRVTIASEDRLAAKLSQRAQVVQNWVLLREQLDTAEAIADETKGSRHESTREQAKKEIKQILKAAQPVYYRLETLTRMVIEITVECKKPLRDDLQRGFPRDLRESADPAFFDDED